jgi:tRNA pseudouridine38-40 synthase
VSARVGPDEHRIRLTLHYDGRAFAGWQVQPGERTVQGELEAALARLITVPTRVIAAGRTDRGVHATGQVVGAVVPRRWGAAELWRALNAVLPDDIWVADATDVRADFHARYDAVARGYTYRVGTAPVSRSPFFRGVCWPLGLPLPLDALNAAAARFVGDHSFLAFARTGQPERGDRCTVYAADWVPWTPVGVTFRIVANRFLHHMVRYMVGTMVDVARGRRTIDEIDRMLAHEAGVATSAPAPAGGLFLTRVFYGDDVTAGSAGRAGGTGDVGDVGDAGRAGDVGDADSAGGSGDTGDTGDAGDTGDTDDAGRAGGGRIWSGEDAGDEVLS